MSHTYAAGQVLRIQHWTPEGPVPVTTHDVTVRDVTPDNRSIQFEGPTFPAAWIEFSFVRVLEDI